MPLDGEQRINASAGLRSRLAALEEGLGPGALLGFAPLSSEPDIAAFLETAREQGRTVLLPRPGAEEGSLEAVRSPVPSPGCTATGWGCGSLGRSVGAALGDRGRPGPRPDVRSLGTTPRKGWRVTTIDFWLGSLAR